jgi:hypothetical protein
VYVSDVPTYRQTRGHGKETGTEIHLKVKTHHYLRHVDGAAAADIIIIIIINNRTIPNNKPDIIICANKKKTCMLIDVTILG